ncbi:MAG: single-stranded DNA-binding protein [Muribaculaceae bacterium]|nr:single-stranded DNA-binding protein [Muribaculaceae bacterium]
MSVNKVILIGNVGGDPEVRYPEKDFPVAYFSLATNELRGQTEVTEWHNIVMTGDNAKYAERYIRKGTKLYVEGTLRTRQYTDKFNITRKRTEIYANIFEMLGRLQ